MRRYGDADRYEGGHQEQVLRWRNRHPDRVQQLLTGFTLCQVLYIDKELKEHGLLQAIKDKPPAREARTTA